MEKITEVKSKKDGLKKRQSNSNSEEEADHKKEKKDKKVKKSEKHESEVKKSRKEKKSKKHESDSKEEKKEKSKKHKNLGSDSEKEKKSKKRKHDEGDENGGKKHKKSKDADELEGDAKQMSKKLKLDSGNALPVIAPVSRLTAQQWRKENDMTAPIGCPDPMQSFEDLALPDYAKKALDCFKFEKPTPVQAQSWPIVLSGRDMIAIAETGSGKTLAFVLPALIHIRKSYEASGVNFSQAARPQQARPPPPFGNLNNPPFGSRGYTQQKPTGPLPYGRSALGLFLAPTRELAIQINGVCQQACQLTGMDSVCIYGGAPKSAQLAGLRRGCDIIVATPGRCFDLFYQGLLKLDRVSFVVLDEADRMLDMGFEPQIKEILSHIKAERQTMMFSATWPKEIQTLARNYQREPIKIEIGISGLKANRNITQIFKFCPFEQRSACLMELLNEVFRDNCKILIFNNTKAGCESIGQELWDAGKPCNVIHGDMDQPVRERALENFRNGKYPILIATDVAARGIDIRDIKCVINYTIPPNVEDYVHRIGRTGRGGDTGTAYSIVCPKDNCPSRELVSLLHEAKQSVPDELLHRTAGRGFKRWGGGSVWGTRRGGGAGGGRRGGFGGR